MAKIKTKKLDRVVNYIVPTALLLFFGWFIFSEIYQLEIITWQLNSIPNVRVLNAWGHDDITIEEVSARLLIDESKELVLENLSRDVFNYPNQVLIPQFGDFSFVSAKYYDDYIDISNRLDIGTKNILQIHLGRSFNSPREVIDNYDYIYDNLIVKIPEYPNYFHYVHNGKEEIFVTKIKKKSKDVDPIFSLFNSPIPELKWRELPWELDGAKKSIKEEE